MTEDEFFDGMEQLIRATAQASDFVSFDGATTEQVDIVIELQHVSRVLAEHCRRVLMDGKGDWLEVAEMLTVAAATCRNEAVIEGELTEE